MRLSIAQARALGIPEEYLRLGEQAERAQAVREDLILGDAALSADEPPKRNKYGARRTEYNGVWYDSAAEAKRAAELDSLIGSGNVLWWVRQVIFRLGCPENTYRCDFLVVEPGGVWGEQVLIHVEDVKGASTAKFRRDVKLWKKYGPCALHILGRKGTEVIERAAPNGDDGEV